MVERFFIFVVFSFILFVSCNKIKDADIPDNTKDTLVQFFEFTVNDSICRFMENDTVTFNPDKGTVVQSNDSINFLYRSNLFITVEHKMINSSSYKNYIIGFSAKLAQNQMDWKHKINNHIVPVLYPYVFESLFRSGNMNYTVQDCYNSFQNIASVAIGFPFYGIYSKSFYSSNPGCLTKDEENNYKQDNSYFTIDVAERYQHKKYGDCILLTGEFHVILYYAPNSLSEEKLVLNNGRFKILVTDNNWLFSTE